MEGWLLRPCGTALCRGIDEGIEARESIKVKGTRAAWVKESKFNNNNNNNIGVNNYFYP